jgi:hypothetical protein
MTPILFHEQSNLMLQQADVGKIFDKYPEGDAGPRVHPIVSYVAKEWDRAAVETQPVNLDALKLSEVAELCMDGVAKHPSWKSKLHTQELRLHVWKVNGMDMWWLPPLPVEEAEGDTGA